MLFGFDDKQIQEKLTSPYVFAGYQEPMPLDWSGYGYNQDQNFPDMI